MNLPGAARMRTAPVITLLEKASVQRNSEVQSVSQVPATVKCSAAVKQTEPHLRDSGGDPVKLLVAVAHVEAG